MLSLALSAAFALPVPAVDDELTALTNKLAEAKSYAFTVQTESDGGGFGGGRGRGGRGGEGGGEGQGEPQAAPITQGTFQAGLPMHVVIGETEAFKDGDQVVHKDAGGKWKVMEDPRSMFGRGGFGRGGGGGEQGGEERRRRRGEGGGEGSGGGEGAGGGEGRGQGGGERGQRGGEGAGGDDERRTRMASMRAMLSLSRVNAPHAMFAEFGGQIEKAEKTAGEAEGVTIWKGTLTDEAVEKMQASSRGGRGRGGSGGGRGGRGGQGGEGGDGPIMDTIGSFTITVKGGKITAATFEIITEGFFRDREFSRTTKTNLTFGKIGKAEVKVPDEALAHFEI